MIALGIEGLGPGTLIGGGGSAVVFSALRLSDDLAVAVKVLRLTAADPRTRKQFDREAEAIARLGEHKGIISILSSGITDRGEPYLVMPLMKTSLQQKLEEFGPAPWQEAGSILIDVCDAVEFAHRRNVLHRDIKPANILVNKNGNPVVADFGIAKFVDGTQTMSTLVAATPGFAPPERLRGLAASERSDVYSLAAMFYALVAGSGPFEEPDMQVEAMMRHVLESEPTPLIDLVPDIPKLLSRTVAEALHKDPNRRPDSASAFAATIRAALGQEHDHAAASTVRFTQQSAVNAEAGPEVQQQPVGRNSPTAHMAQSPEPKRDRSRQRTALLAASLVAVFVVGVWSLLQVLDQPADPGEPPESDLATQPVTTNEEQPATNDEDAVSNPTDNEGENLERSADAGRTTDVLSDIDSTPATRSSSPAEAQPDGANESTDSGSADEAAAQSMTTNAPVLRCW